MYDNPSTLATPAQPVAAAASQLVLIVEDEFAVANDLRRILEKSGYQVSGIAFSVAKALELIGQQRPDLVLLDIHLKGTRTGIDLARLLAHDDIPFVYVSANTNNGILEEVKTTQPYGFIVKPFGKETCWWPWKLPTTATPTRIEYRTAP
jgi:CheY-like chemotaxis protein